MLAMPRAVAALLFFVLLAGSLSARQPDPAKKYALLVGVNNYAHADLNKPLPLQYAEADIVALQEVLEQSGYQVVVLLGGRATLIDIRAALATLRKNGNGASVVLTAFAGHGLQPEGSKEAYFFPYDADQAVFDRGGTKEADWDMTNTMLPLSEVLTELRACGAESKALLVDACRNDPKTGRGRGFGTQFNAEDLPENLALMLSCSRGERAWEDKAWGQGHGAVFYHVLTGVRDGKAAIDGHVTANSLIAYVGRAVRTEVPTIIGGGATQRPHAIINGEVDLGIDLRRSSPFHDSYTNSLGMKFKLIPAGVFQMGAARSEGSDDDEQPVHRVRITHPFYLGILEVTKGQFAQFVAAESYRTEAERDGTGGLGVDDYGNWSQKPEYTWRNPGFPQTDEHPVVNVSWNDAVAFCDWLSRKEGKKYLLPTEAQWEYACRAGTTTPYFHGADPEELASVGNVADGTLKTKFSLWTTITARDGYVYTAPVGKFRPNAFGLYDMHGNVWEWCADWYDGDYYRSSPVDDPMGAATGSHRVIRGGSWYGTARYARSAYRYSLVPSNRYADLGFRVALSPFGE